MTPRIKFVIASVIIGAIIATSIFPNAPDSVTESSIHTPSQILRIGYFPILNHAQAVIGLAKGDFQKAVGKEITIKPEVFDSGPPLIEALFANQIDLAYVGPNPTINGYVVSDGKALKIISGASSGGTVLVVRNDSGIKSIKDFGNKRFATPQVGNTQDVALREYLLQNGYKTKEDGGKVEVISAQISDIFTLMLTKQIDGAWVPEPWGTKLVKEANGRIFLDERVLWPQGKYITANVIARTDYLRDNPETVKKFLATHIDETNWINSHKSQAMDIFNEQLKALTGHIIKPDELKQAWSRIEFTYDPLKPTLLKSANDSLKIGFLRTPPNLTGIYDLTLLNTVLEQKHLQPIRD
ncbi:MAG TPA: aliphatic sulfonate ABC transporter substrate-binding protein [Candidatus Bathyarchaeia archaeon]|jgi:NitT/TauT family transport system substrate-binding protein|nr:aliphatic sulfonate ABC transporter substrate-binding protein [Candidatus Bathyarchaeia archaeon]